MATADFKELRAGEDKKPRGRHFGAGTEDNMDRDDERMETPRTPSSPVGLNEEARDMRNAGRKLEAQEPDGDDIYAVARRLEKAVREQEANNRQHAKDMGRILDELRQIVTEVERIRSDAQDESHTAQQAALSGVNRAQQEAEQLTIRNLDKVTKKSTEYIDSMVQLAKRRIERLALITLPDKLFNTLKWVVLILLLFILSQMAWRMIA